MGPGVSSVPSLGVLRAPGARVSRQRLNNNTVAKFDTSPIHEISRADGESKKFRVQDGHLFVCHGCCCGRTEKGFPSLPIDEFKKQWKARGIRRRFHLTISGCLGPCTLANVAMVQFHGETVWLHSISAPSDVDLILRLGGSRC